MSNVLALRSGKKLIVHSPVHGKIENKSLKQYTQREEMTFKTRDKTITATRFATLMSLSFGGKESFERYDELMGSNAEWAL